MKNPYGAAYRRARAALLASSPLCATEGCDALATTADHDPPVAVAGPHLNLVPRCAMHNYSDGGKLSSARNQERAYKSSREW